ncbi:hypothetical protein QJV14_02450 [Listeria cossartiae subsp. cayugensis]|uniref:hypothetical protein n=1 Tax=Listeria cossartiae TaxID=2838249 RepID=UPI0028807BC7|nr:hypothetical protein [Listeria cossartiae]MDS9999626.1 hypothetical protein [Listeria cossartiae subsp. cayugensis]MDT0002837.1 hypothetical protein [Listeria cossartiae subsp. cayugensis]MDT0007927.1 hypothetical protein [Listeria cossartiae subsp. cayugensis]MDT0018795.1 hypothetical protein [Listeria cossartiae subsp. cayugensis]MDT0029658.1 hypothetical protein [Listeria cossartiae subsp. cayugensis]
MTKNIFYRELLKNFREIPQNDKNLESYGNYYQAYVKFVNEYRDFFTDSILEKWGLDVLISINSEEYIVSTPDLSLYMEKQRLSKGEYKNIDTLAMSIRDTLWDMVTVYSGKDCPITPNDELIYIKVKRKDNSDKILLECAGCGWAEDIEGEEYTGDFGKVFPVNEKDFSVYIK